MNRIYIALTLLVSAFFISGCNKKTKEPPVIIKVSEQDVLTDFAHVLVNPNYQDIQNKAQALFGAIQQLHSTPNDANLLQAQDAWRAVRVPWEQCEAFLFGPVEDFNYDPATDTWPVSTVELDSLLASSNPLTLNDINALPYSLKGYHPIEYILFGVGGSKTAAQLTPRQLQYILSLSESLYNSTTDLRNSWDVSQPGNFTEQLITAGNGSTHFSTRKDAFIAIVTAMASICNEVANGKMQDPLSAHDSTLVESQYAHNATEDFTNNIRGIRNAYFCQYHITGTSLHQLVASYDLSLDQSISSHIDAALAALAPINSNFGEAIFTQVGSIQQAQNAISTLEGSLNLLNNFIQTHIND